MVKTNKKRAYTKQDEINFSKGRKQFTKDYQPTPEAKSNGWKKAMSLKAIAKMLGEGRPAEKVVEEYKKIFPDIDEKQITHDMVIIAGQYHKAEIDRDTTATRFIADLKGATKSVEVIAPIQITFNDERFKKL